MIDKEVTKKYLNLIVDEMERASSVHSKFASVHEGYAIILEEMDELWDAIKMKENSPMRKFKCRAEAIQVGAMALRFLHDLEEE